MTTDYDQTNKKVDYVFVTGDRDNPNGKSCYKDYSQTRYLMASDSYNKRKSDIITKIAKISMNLAENIGFKGDVYPLYMAMITTILNGLDDEDRIKLIRSLEPFDMEKEMKTIELEKMEKHNIEMMYKTADTMAERLGVGGIKTLFEK